MHKYSKKYEIKRVVRRIIIHAFSLKYALDLFRSNGSVFDIVAFAVKIYSKYTCKVVMVCFKWIKTS